MRDRVTTGARERHEGRAETKRESVARRLEFQSTSDSARAASTAAQESSSPRRT